MSAPQRTEPGHALMPMAAWGITHTVCGQPGAPRHSHLLAARAHARQAHRVQEDQLEADMAGVSTSRTPQA